MIYTNYTSAAKAFKTESKNMMDRNKAGDRRAYFKYRGLELIALDESGERIDSIDPDYLEQKEVSGKEIYLLVEGMKEDASRMGEVIHSFSLAGGLDYYESFSDAMRYPDDYEPWADSFDITLSGNAK